MAGSGSRSSSAKASREVIRPEANSSPRLPSATYDQRGFQTIPEDTATPFRKRGRGKSPIHSKRPVAQAQFGRLPSSHVTDKGQTSRDGKFKMASDHFLTNATLLAEEFTSNVQNVLDETWENGNLKKANMEEKIEILTKRNFDLQAMLLDNHEKLKSETARRVEAERLYASVVENGGRARERNGIDLNVDAVIDVDAEKRIVPTEGGKPYWWRGSHSGRAD